MMELDLLRGTERTIRRFRPVLYVETGLPTIPSHCCAICSNSIKLSIGTPSPCITRVISVVILRIFFLGVMCVNVLCIRGEQETFGV